MPHPRVPSEFLKPDLKTISLCQHAASQRPYKDEECPICITLLNEDPLAADVTVTFNNKSANSKTKVSVSNKSTPNHLTWCKMGCGRTFHQSCIESAINHSLTCITCETAKCPYCRQEWVVLDTCLCDTGVSIRSLYLLTRTSLQVVLEALIKAGPKTVFPAWLKTILASVMVTIAAVGFIFGLALLSVVNQMILRDLLRVRTKLGPVCTLFLWTAVCFTIGGVLMKILIIQSENKAMRKDVNRLKKVLDIQLRGE